MPKTAKTPYGIPSLAGLIILTLAGLLASCAPPPPTPWSRTAAVFGDIPASLTVYGPEDAALFDGYIDLINGIDKEMSMWDRPYVTDVMRLADAAGSHPVVVSPDTLDVIKRALEIGDATDGALDVAIGPLVKLWGIATDHPKVPAQAEVEKLLPVSRRQDIVLADKTAFLKRKGMIVDVGGIAKGFAADQAVAYLKSKGVTSAIIDIGGNVYAMGSKPTASGPKPWSIGIQDPDRERGNVVGTLAVIDESVVTSGVYERKFTDPATGKTYHHILDPKTGWPADNGLVSVSIVGKASIDCDGFAKLLVLGLDRAAALTKTLKLQAIFITADKKVYLTPELAKNFTLKAADYKLADLP
jgi:thiamine biosynthesis lipoprotein